MKTSMFSSLKDFEEPKALAEELLVHLVIRRARSTALPFWKAHGMVEGSTPPPTISRLYRLLYRLYRLILIPYTLINLINDFKT